MIFLNVPVTSLLLAEVWCKMASPNSFHVKPGCNYQQNNLKVVLYSYMHNHDTCMLCTGKFDNSTYNAMPLNGHYLGKAS